MTATLDPQLISAALSQLSAEHRAILLRSHQQSWTITDIATDLHISEDTVTARLHDAAHALRHLLHGSGITTRESP